MKLKDILIELTEAEPYAIGFRTKSSKPDYTRYGFVKEFLKFFSFPGGGPEPIGIYMDMANAVAEKYPDLEPLLRKTGETTDELFNYINPRDKASPYSLHDLTQDGADQVIYKYMMQANTLAKKIISTVNKADEKKIATGLKGLTGILKRGKNIFTSSFGPLKKRGKVGFKIRKK